MGRGTKIIDKLLKKIPGGVFGLASVAIILFGDFIAILSFPGYNFFENMVSELGVSPRGIFFNIGIILSGILAMPFYIHLSKTFVGENINENLRKTAIISSMISCITYCFLGVFPAVESDFILYHLHGILAFVSMTSGVGYLISFNLLIIKTSKFKKSQAYLGFFVAALYTFFLCTWWPIIEWIMSFAVITWIIFVSASLLKYQPQYEIQYKT